MLSGKITVERKNTLHFDKGETWESELTPKVNVAVRFSAGDDVDSIFEKLDNVIRQLTAVH